MAAKPAKATKSDKPNILVIWGDDIGIANLSCYSHGVMGYRTPNIDRLAKEGMMFTDSYGEQSCTAGRSSFITGQSVFRWQHPNSFTIDDAIAALTEASSGGKQ